MRTYRPAIEEEKKAAEPVAIPIDTERIAPKKKSKKKKKKKATKKKVTDRRNVSFEPAQMNIQDDFVLENMDIDEIMRRNGGSTPKFGERSHHQ